MVPFGRSDVAMPRAEGQRSATRMANIVHYETPSKCSPLGVAHGHLYYVYGTDSSTVLCRRLPERPDEEEAVATMPYPVYYFFNPALSRCKQYFYAVGRRDTRAAQPWRQGYVISRLCIATVDVLVNDVGHARCLVLPTLYVGSENVYCMFQVETTSPEIQDRYGLATYFLYAKTTEIYRVVLGPSATVAHLHGVSFMTPPLRLFPHFGGPDDDVDGPQSREDLSAFVIEEVDATPVLFSCNTDGIVYVNIGSSWMAPELEHGSEKVPGALDNNDVNRWLYSNGSLFYYVVPDRQCSFTVPTPFYRVTFGRDFATYRLQKIGNVALPQWPSLCTDGEGYLAFAATKYFMDLQASCFFRMIVFAVAPLKQLCCLSIEKYLWSVGHASHLYRWHSIEDIKRLIRLRTVAKDDVVPPPAESLIGACSCTSY